MSKNIRSQCIACKHLTLTPEGDWICPAYPEGIPDAIQYNEVRHTKPYKQSNDTVWEPRTPDDEGAEFDKPATGGNADA